MSLVDKGVMKITPKIEKWLLDREIRKQELRIKERGERKAFWASEASMREPGGKLFGKCLRAIWWEWHGEPYSNPMDGRGVRTVQAGIAFENEMNDVFKEMGWWDSVVAERKKFYNEDMNVSGEVDAFIRVEDQTYGVEYKTLYGYFANRDVFKKGNPKIDHLLQTAIYIRHFDLPFKLLYGARDTQEIKEFDITLKDKNLLMVNGRTFKKFPITIDAILARFEEFKKHLDLNTIPPRDYPVLGLTLTELETARKLGELSRTESDLLDKGRRVTKIPWQCSFCRYYYKCLKIAQEEIKSPKDINLTQSK